MKQWMAFGLTVFLVGNQYIPAREYYVRLPFEGRESIEKWVAEGYDLGGINRKEKRFTLVVPEERMETFRGMRTLGFDLIRKPDDGYRTPEEVDTYVHDLEKAFPQLVRVESIGKSSEGRDIWGVKLSNDFVSNGTPKPTIVFDAMHHAREVMTTEITFDIMEYLTSQYGTDPKVTKWMNENEIWVVPMVNPDGNNRVWTQYSMWRKNTNGSGVDVNRNYPYGWNTCNGSSSSPASDIYRGKSAGSETETQALMGLIARVQPKYNISYHSFSEIVIYPFGCSPQKVQDPDAKIYIKNGKELASRLKTDSGSGSYDPGTSYELLYNVDGGSIDWMYTQHKVMSYVIEVNSDSQGFQPSYSRWRDVTVKKQREGWQFLLDQMAGPGIK